MLPESIKHMVIHFTRLLKLKNEPGFYVEQKKKKSCSLMKLNKSINPLFPRCWHILGFTFLTLQMSSHLLEVMIYYCNLKAC